MLRAIALSLALAATPTAPVAASKAEFPTLRIITSLNPWGSDHVSFINRGMPALPTIENDWDDYPAYHRTNDTPDRVSIPIGTETLKMNAAAEWQWAGE